MTIDSVVVGGRVEVTVPPGVPDGTKVRVEIPVRGGPFEPYDRETEVAILKRSHEEAKAGDVVEARAFLKQLAIDHNLPLLPGE
jgi:hypothetical protein